MQITAVVTTLDMKNVAFDEGELGKTKDKVHSDMQKKNPFSFRIIFASIFATSNSQ